MTNGRRCDDPAKEAIVSRTIEPWPTQWEETAVENSCESLQMFVRSSCKLFYCYMV